jgi:hypothetical protein
MKYTRTLFAALLFTAQATLQAASTVFDPCDFGAKSDGKTLCTEAIQKAIDAGAAAGGGTVRLAGGQFLSGTIHLRSHVTLEVAGGAALLGSTNIVHYPDYLGAVVWLRHGIVKQSLIVGENLDDVGLIGSGVIDGQGGSFHRLRTEDNRPYLIRLINCRDVRVEGLRLQNSGMWMQHYLACQRVTVRGIRVWNFSNYNNDGIDLDGCKDCTVSQCVFDSDDDGITLKSTCELPSENITISDCIARSHCNAIKLGTESNGGFKNITIANCIVGSPEHPKVFYGRPRGISGISLELVDGGQLECVTIANIVIRGVEVPLFLRLGDRARPFKKDMPPIAVGRFRDVVINNIIATDAGKIGCSITGVTNASIENITLSNMQIQFEGGGARELADKSVKELPNKYPEAFMFGELPAYGFYCRHVKGLRFSNVQLRTAAAEQRHAMAFDDVEDLAIDGLDATFSPGGAPMLSLIQSRGAIVRGCQPRAKDGLFLKLAGDKSRNIALIANDLSGAAKAADAAPDVPKDALSLK